MTKESSGTGIWDFSKGGKRTLKLKNKGPL